MICDFTDPHNQHFLRGDNNTVSSIAVSPSVGLGCCVSHRCSCAWLLLTFMHSPSFPQPLRHAQGRLVASGHSGESADVYVWDFVTRERLYRYAPATLVWSPMLLGAPPLIPTMLVWVCTCAASRSTILALEACRSLQMRCRYSLLLADPSARVALSK